VKGLQEFINVKITKIVSGLRNGLRSWKLMYTC